MPPEQLAQVLRSLENLFPAEQHPELLVGLGAPDDAAVYKLNDQQALIQTVDFFTPIVDTPYEYGAIAAANALSDVYAMGGQVLFALNIAAFPPNLPASMLSEILRGGADVVRSVGAVIAGGHTIQDKEPKYGLAVTGIAHPDRILTKGGARPGDILILTKRLGTGVITTALKRDLADDDEIEAAVGSMMALNRVASEACLVAQVRSATDITGFGLLGHALEMSEASGVGFRIRYGYLPWLHHVDFHARHGVFPGGAFNNRDFYSPFIRYAGDIPEWQQLLLHDPQTSGGLLAAVPRLLEGEFIDYCSQHGQEVWVIGDVVEGEGIEVI